MAGNFVDSLVIGIGLDTSQIAEGVQKVGAQLDSGLSAAAQSAASKMSPLGEALKGLADKAGEVAKPAKESLQALHGLGLKAASEYQEQIDAIKAGLAQIQNDPALSASDKASAMDAASAKIDELKTKMDGLKEPASEAMQVLKDLGIRTTEEIQKSLDALKAKLAAVQNDPALTARDKMAAMKELQAQIERTEMELKRGLPQAAAQGFAGAEAAANKFKGFMSSIWAQVSGPLMGAFAIGGSVSNYISNSMSAGELADKLKVDIEEIQIWSGAMERAGGSASGLQATIEKLNASGKAQGDAIGVLLGLADKAGTMSKEAFVQKAKELEIDEQTIEVLAQGRKALDEHLKRQRELGAYTKEDAENSKKFKQALADLLAAWDGFTSFIGRIAVPVMEQVAKIFTELVVYLRKHPALVAAAIALVGGALTAKLLPPLKALPAIIANVSKAFMRWFPIVAVIMAIAAVFEDFWVYLHGGKSALEDVWKVFGTGPELLAKFRAAWEDLKGVIKTVWEGIKQFASYLGGLAKASGWVDGLKNALKGVAQIFKGLFSGNIGDIGKGLGTMLRGLGQMVLGSLRSLGTIVKDLFKNLFNFDGGEISFTSVVTAIWNAITTVFTNLGKFIKGFFEGVFDVELPSLGELGTKIWNTITQIFADLKKKVTDFFKNMFSDIELPSIGDILGGAGDLAKGAAGAVGDLAKGAGDLLGKGLDLGKEGAAKVGEWFSGLFGDAKDGAAKIGAKLGPMLSDGIEEAKTRLGKAGDLLVNLIGDGAESAAKIGEKLGPALQGGLDIAKRGLGAVGNFFGGLFGDAQPATDEAGGKIQDGMDRTAAAVRDGFNAAWSATRDFAVTQFQSAATTIQGIFAGIVAGIEAQVGALVAGAQAMMPQPGMVPASAGVRPQQAGGGRGVQINQTNRTTIHAPGGDPAQVRQAAESGQGKSNRALVQAAQRGTVQK